MKELLLDFLDSGFTYHESLIFSMTKLVNFDEIVLSLSYELQETGLLESFDVPYYSHVIMFCVKIHSRGWVFA